MTFPKPIRISGNTTRWRLSALRAYEAELAGDDANPAPENEKFLTARQVAARYGVHVASVWRWVSSSETAAA